MTTLVLVTLILLIVLLGVYVTIENNRKKAREAEKRAFNERVKEINAHFKEKLVELVDAKIVRPKYMPKLQAITSNFFVVQHHTEENLTHLERVSEQFLAAVGKELQKCMANNLDVDLLATQMQYFVAELPSQGIGYNKTFYNEIYPALLLLLQIPESTATQSEQMEGTDDQALAEDNQDKQPPQADDFISTRMNKAQELQSS